MIEDQIEKYITKTEDYCPICNGDKVQEEPATIGNNECRQVRSCSLCNYKWVDIYNLVGVIEA